MDSTDDLRLTPRQRTIIRHVSDNGFASIESMAETFGVSAQTIRREIIRLSEQNLLQRYHGGAGLPAARETLAYSNRRVRNAEEKRQLAEAVAREIPNGASLFLDIGTTVEAVAAALVKHTGLRVITVHILVAALLCEHTDFEIILAGGLVRNRDRAVTGDQTTEFLRRFRVNFGIFSAGSIDANGQVLDYDYRDVQVSRIAMEVSRRRFLVVDSSKFDADAMVRIADLSEIDAVFSNAAPPPAIAEQMSRHETRLVLPPRIAPRALPSPRLRGRR